MDTVKWVMVRAKKPVWVGAKVMAEDFEPIDLVGAGFKPAPATIQTGILTPTSAKVPWFSLFAEK